MTKKTAWKRVAFDKENPQQRKELLLLLEEAFGKTYRPYYELQLQTVASPDRTFLIENEGEKLIGHVQVVPYHAFLLEKHAPLQAAYLYAICTQKSERGKGVMHSLLQQVLEQLPQQGYDFALLLPADKDLIDFYKRFNFELSEGGSFTQIPRCYRPSIRPGEEAQLFLSGASELDAEFDPALTGSTQKHPADIFVPLEHPVSWMWHPLHSDIQLPPQTALLNPMT